MSDPSYYSYNQYLRKTFKTRVHRLSLNAGFGCPNRDGTLSEEGCFFCNEAGFVNFPDNSVALREQIERSMVFYKERYGARKFIAYFQNGSNTYAPLPKLKETYDTIKEYPDIVGLSISTRPDCIDPEKLDLISSYSGEYDVWVEYGLQSICNKTLREMNRSGTYEQFLDAVDMTVKSGIKAGAHIILGLPGEDRKDMIETAKELSRIPVSGIKIHVFHILRDTKCEALYNEGRFSLLGRDEYIPLVCDMLERLDPKIVIMRLISNARSDLLIAPTWINNKHNVLRSVEDEFSKRATSQGSKYEEENQAAPTA